MSDALERITTMADLLVKADEKVDAAKKELEAAQKEFTRLEREDLPDLMREIGVDEIKLANGASVKVIEDLNCSISEARAPAAHSWLTARGFDGLIKSNVMISFAREERAEAASAMQLIEETLHKSAELVEKVHPATLKSFIKEQREKGNSVPEDLFGIFVFSKAKITAPRAKG